MKKLTIFITLIASIFFVSFAFGESITFTFANSQNSGTTQKYYEFDVMAQAAASGTKFGDLMVYINYNTAGFGESIVFSNNITISKGTLLQGDVSGSEKYSIVNMVDNSSSRIAVTIGYNFESVPSWGNDLPTNPTQLLHCKIKIQNQSASSGISFQQSLMDGQEYESNNSDKYNPVIANDTDDISLPIILSSFTGEFYDQGIILKWKTQSEVNILGFNLYRALSDSTDFMKVNNSIIRSRGNSTIINKYSYMDMVIPMENKYFYRIEVVELNGNRKICKNIAMKRTNRNHGIPNSYKIVGSFPNPFKSSTEIKYQIAKESFVSVDIFNLLGQHTAILVHENMKAGYHSIRWNGLNKYAEHVPDGLYIIRLSAKGFVMCKKILLLH